MMHWARTAWSYGAERKLYSQITSVILCSSLFLSLRKIAIFNPVHLRAYSCSSIIVVHNRCHGSIPQLLYWQAAAQPTR